MLCSFVSTHKRYKRLHKTTGLTTFITNLDGFITPKLFVTLLLTSKFSPRDASLSINKYKGTIVLP